MQQHQRRGAAGARQRGVNPAFPFHLPGTPATCMCYLPAGTLARSCPRGHAHRDTHCACLARLLRCWLIQKTWQRVCARGIGVTSPTVLSGMHTRSALQLCMRRNAVHILWAHAAKAAFPCPIDPATCSHHEIPGARARGRAHRHAHRYTGDTGIHNKRLSSHLCAVRSAG